MDNVISLGEARAGGAESWTPREALLSMLKKLDSGELQADALIVGAATIMRDGSVGVALSSSGGNILVTLGLLDLMKQEVRNPVT